MLRRSSIERGNPCRFTSRFRTSCEVLLEHRLVRAHAAVRRQHVGGGRRPGHAAGPRAREQPRHEVGAIVGHLDDRLVHEVLHHVLAADVDDERHARLERGDVGEVLVRSDAEVDAVWRHAFSELGDHFLKSGFVRDEIVRTEEAVRLREVDDHLPERAVRYLSRQVAGGDAVAWAEQPDARQAEEHGDERKDQAASQHGGCVRHLSTVGPV